MEELKLCKDCKHCRRDPLLGYEYAKCRAIADPVSGKPRWYCSTERDAMFDANNRCGSQGKLWERKESFGKRILALFA